MTNTKTRMTGPQIEALIADHTGIYDFLTNRVRTPRHLEARALAYHVAMRDGWNKHRIARWAGYIWDTIDHSLQTHDLADEAAHIYNQHHGIHVTW